MVHEIGSTVKKYYPEMKRQKMRFGSSLYYFKNYRGANFLQIAAAWLSFEMFAYLYSVKTLIKKCLVRGGP